MKYLILTILLAACATSKEPAQDHMDPIDELREIVEPYRTDVEAAQDSYGFVHSDKCDSGLYSGLVCAAGFEVDVTGARNSTGQYFRTPYKDCYSNELKYQKDPNFYHSRQSKSQISRDPLTAYMWCLETKGDVKSLDDMRKWGKAHNWKMGNGPADRVYMTTNLQRTLYELSGKTWEGEFLKWALLPNDYDRHVVALNIDLYGEKMGHISSDMLNVIKRSISVDPKNAYFHFILHRYTDGDQSEPIELAKELAIKYPPGKRCRRWLFERHSSSWDGCKEEDKVTATGGEHLFLLKRLEDSKDESN